MLMPESDDVRDDEMDEFTAEFERHRHAIYDLISDYMDEVDIDPAYVAHILVDMMIGMRMTGYGLAVESPSAAGLKLDLDRLQKEVSELVRNAKRGAEEYIVHVREARAAADAEEGGDDKDEERPK
jgi:hypothetical protein